MYAFRHAFRYTAYGSTAVRLILHGVLDYTRRGSLHTTSLVFLYYYRGACVLYVTTPAHGKRVHPQDSSTALTTPSPQTAVAPVRRPPPCRLCSRRRRSLCQQSQKSCAPRARQCGAGMHARRIQPGCERRSWTARQSDVYPPKSSTAARGLGVLEAAAIGGRWRGGTRVQALEQPRLGIQAARALSTGPHAAGSEQAGGPPEGTKIAAAHFP